MFLGSGRTGSRYARSLTTLVLRLSSWLNRSRLFVVRRRRRCSSGSVKLVSASSMSSLIHRASAGWEALQRSAMSRASCAAHSRVGAANTAFRLLINAAWCFLAALPLAFVKKVCLAALPGCALEVPADGVSESAVIVASRHAHAVKAALL